MAVVTGPFNDFTDFNNYYLPVALTLDRRRARIGQLKSYMLDDRWLIEMTTRKSGFYMTCLSFSNSREL